jgi:hemerythrin-like metal-binding protein
MAYFEWADDMEIDRGPIDQDHRLLVEQVNALHTATSQGVGQEVVAELLEALERDTIEHIRREEHFMHSVGYPETEGHRKGHQRFVDELRVLRQRQAQGHVTVAAQLSQLLRDWLSVHIRRNDKDVKVFLQRRERERDEAVLRGG